MGVGGQPHATTASTPGKDPVPIVQEARWAPEPVWTGAENLAPIGIWSPDRPARRQSLYRLSYRAHLMCIMRKFFSDIGYFCADWSVGTSYFDILMLSCFSVVYLMTNGGRHMTTERKVLGVWVQNADFIRRLNSGVDNCRSLNQHGGCEVCRGAYNFFGNRIIYFTFCSFLWYWLFKFNTD